MKITKIKNAEIIKLLDADSAEFPKYATQIMNLANQNALGTRPAVVGQMSELIKEFDGSGLEEWGKWYITKYPDAIENATRKIMEMIENLKQSIGKINEEMVRKWVRELVIVKTYVGLKFHEAILSKVAEDRKIEFRKATTEEESKGIDGFIGEIPVSIKPTSYETKPLPENIDVKMIFYEKTKDGITVSFDEF
jgi:hypothetical protein